MTQTGCLRSFRGTGCTIGSVSYLRISTKLVTNACNFARGVLSACENISKEDRTSSPPWSGVG